MPAAYLQSLQSRGTVGEEGWIYESINSVMFWIIVSSLAFRTPAGESCTIHEGDVTL